MNILAVTLLGSFLVLILQCSAYFKIPFHKMILLPLWTLISFIVRVFISTYLYTVSCRSFIFRSCSTITTWLAFAPFHCCVINQRGNIDSCLVLGSAFLEKGNYFWPVFCRDLLAVSRLWLKTVLTWWDVQSEHSRLECFSYAWAFAFYLCS